MADTQTGISESDKELYWEIEAMVDSHRSSTSIRAIKDFNFFKGVLVGLYEKDKAMREIKRLKKNYGISEEEVK